MARTPRKISIKSSIENGKIVEHKNLIEDAILTYEGKKVKITIERYYKKRSNRQNRYYWGVIVEHWRNLLREEWGEILDAKSVHEFLKANLNFEEVINYETGEVLMNPLTKEVIRKPKSTTNNTTFSQEEYHKSCRDLAFEMFNYLIPLPKEDLAEAIDIKA